MQNMFSKDSIEFLVLKNDFESQNFAIFGGHKQTNFALGLSMLTEAKRMNGASG